MDPISAFYLEKQTSLARYPQDPIQKQLTADFLKWCFDNRYMYHFEALGRPIIQFPADIIAIQEIIWATRPDLIIETGIAHGGSVVNSAHMLATLDLADAMSSGGPYDWANSRRRVIAVDVDIRTHNQQLIDSHPLQHFIKMIEGSSIDIGVVKEIERLADGYDRVLVLLDSHHTHDHVLAELNAYAPLVSPGSYCVVYDTVIEDLPQNYFLDRPWEPGNSPFTAVESFLAQSGVAEEFERTHEYNTKLVLSGCRAGYLQRRVKDLENS
tara:strand:+ start:757 stop:1563 length:807 start_codon:yes stop_codon:yes gene_type:complete